MKFSVYFRSSKKFKTVAFLVLSLCIKAQSQTIYYWNPQGVSTSFNTAGNWYSSAVPGTATIAPSNVSPPVYLSFSSGAPSSWAGNGTITVNSSFTLAQYTGSSPNSIIITPSGGSITLNSSGGSGFTVSQNAQITIGPATSGVNALNIPILFSGTATPTLTIQGASTSGDQISGNIAGTGNLSLKGPLVISGSNTYTGSTTITGGTIWLQNFPLPSSAYFYGTAGILDISQIPGTISQTLLLDSTSSYTSSFTINAGKNTLILDASPTGTVSFASIINIGGTPTSGSPGATIKFQNTGTNSGSINISGANSYSSATNIGNTQLSNSAYVILSNSNGFGTNSNVSISSNSTLDISQGLSTPITFTTLSGAGTFITAGTNTPSSGSITIVSGSSNFTGTVSGTYSSGLNLIYQGSQNYSITSLAPFGTITVEGGGTLSWTNNSPAFQGNIAFQPNGTISQLGGYAQYPNGAQTFSGSGTIAVQAIGGIDTNGNTVNWTGTISSTGANNTFIHQDSAGSGQFNYTSQAASLYGIQNKSGTISISGSNPFINTTTSAIIVDGGTFGISQLPGSITIGYLYSTKTSSNSGILDLQGSGSPVLTQLNIYSGNNPNGSSYAATIKGTSSQNISLQNGSLTLTNANPFQNFSGSFSIGSSLGDGVLMTSSLGNISSLSFYGSTGSLILTSAGTSAAPIYLNPSTTAIIDNISVSSGQSVTFSGTLTAYPGTTSTNLVTLIIGNNSTTSPYTGNLTLSGNNLFNNTTTLEIQSGTLTAGSANALNGLSSINLWSEATLNTGANTLTLAQITGMYATGTTSTASSLINNGSLTITKGSYAYPFYGTISGAGSITITGTSTSTSFIGNNTYTGSTTIQDGCSFNTSSLGSTSSYIFAGSATGGGILTIGSDSTYSGSITANANTPATFATNTYNATLSGTITVPTTGSFTKIGVGILTLSANNTASLQGQLNIYGGTIAATSTSLGSPTNILFAKFNGTLKAATAITYSGTVTLGTSATLDTTNGNITLSGPVIYWNDPNAIATTGGSYTGGLTVTGGGTVTLSGTPVAQQTPAVSGQAYNGVTTIVNGKLISNAASLPAFVSNPVTALTANIPKTLVFNAGSGQSATFQASTAFSAFPTVVFLSSGTINTNGNNITANNIIAGSNPTGTVTVTNSFIKAGAGILTLSANNIYSINTQVNAGTLKAGTASIFSGTVQSSGAFGVGSNIVISSGATLDLNGFNNTIANLSGSGTLTNSSGTASALTIATGGTSSLTFSGAISGSAGITFSGSQTLTLSGGGTAGAVQNTGSGSLIIEQPLDVTSFSQLSTGILDFSNIDLGSLPSTGVINASGAASFAGAIKLPKVPPAGTVTLISYSSYTGTFATVNPLGANLNYTGTCLRWIGNSPSGVTGYWNVNANGNWNTATNWSSNPSIPGINGGPTDTYEVAEFFNQTGSSIQVTVNSNVILSEMIVGDSSSTPATSYTLTGTNSIQMGNSTYTTPGLQLYGATGISHTISAPVIVANPLDITSQTQNASLIISGSMSLGSNSVTFTQNNLSPQGAITISGQITGSANSAITLKGGTLALTPSSQNSFSSMQINNGTLQINNYAVPSTTTISLTGTTSTATLQPSSGTVTLSSPISNAGTLSLDGNGNALIFAGTISGSGSVITTGNITLSNKNSFSGSTTVNTGTLTLTMPSALYNSSLVTIASGATVSLDDNTNTLNAIAGSGNLNIGSASLTINNTSSFSGVISGSGTVNFSNGTLTLSGNNTLSGTISLDQNTILKAGSTHAFGTSVIQLSSGSKAQMLGFNNTIGGLSTVSGGSSTVSLKGATLTFNNSTSSSYSGLITGTGNLVFQAGTQTLSGSNSYTGSTTISGGNLILGAVTSNGQGPLGNNTSLTISSGSLNFQNYNQSIGSLAGAGGSINLGSASLTLNNASTTTFSGSISGSGSLIVNKGSLTLSGANSFSGGITIASPATVTTTTTSALGSSNAVNNGSLIFNGSGTISLGSLTNNLNLTTNQPSSVTAFTQGSSATLTMALSPSAGTITATGALTLSGSISLTGSSSGTITLLSGSSRNGFFTQAPSGILYRQNSGKYLVIYNGSSGCSGVWTGNNGNNQWATAGNWQGGSCIPGIAIGVDQTATFPNLAQSYEAVNLNTLPSSPVLAGLDFTAGNTSYTLLGGTITFDATNFDQPQISVLNGSHVIKSNITGSSSSTILYVQIDNGASLNLGSLHADPEANMTNFQEVIFFEGTGNDLGLGSFTNYGIIGNFTNPVNEVSITSSHLYNQYLIVAGNETISGTVSVSGSGALTNLDTILASQFTISSGQLDNQGLISVDTFTVTGGSVTNSDAVTTFPLNFIGGSVVNSGIFTTTDLQISPNFTYTTQLYSQEKYGYIDATKISLDGNLTVQAMPGLVFTANQSFDLIDVATTYNSKFANISYLDFPSNILAEVLYLTNKVVLNLTQFEPTPTAHMGFNLLSQQGMFFLRKVEQLKNRMVDFSEVQNASTTTAMIFEESLVAQNANVLERKEQQLTSRLKEERKPGNFYIAPIGSTTRIQSYKNMPSINMGSVGFITGFDWAFNTEKLPVWIGLGSAFDYEYKLGSVHSNNGSFNANKVHGTVYGAIVPKAVPALNINTLIGYAYSWDTLTRKIHSPKSLKANGNTGESIVNFIFDIEYLLSNNTLKQMPENFSMTPFINVEYINDQIGGYKESGAKTYNLRFKSQTLQSAATMLGSRFNFLKTRKNIKANLELDIAWQYEYINQTRNVHFASTSKIPISGYSTIYAPARNTALISLDLFLQIFDKYLVEVSCDTKWNADYIQAFFYLGTGIQF